MIPLMTKEKCHHYSFGAEVELKIDTKINFMINHTPQNDKIPKVLSV